MIFDYHLHTPLCGHAVGEPYLYVQKAIEKGLIEIGFSDHNPMPYHFDDWRMRLDQLDEYIGLVEETRKKFPQYPIRLGLECDFILGFEEHIRDLSSRAPWDYLIGAVHYISRDWDIDNPSKLDRWKKTDIEATWTEYFSLYTKMACSGLFDFLAHPDLIKKFNHKPSRDLASFYEEALTAMADHHLAFEINTAGLRKPVKEIYPEKRFLEIAYKKNIPILISSDAHDPNEVGQDFDLALDLVREVGYRELTMFKSRKKIVFPL
ncbi:histidinol-phosphatase HisJ family protein [Methylacidiphilum caldifontis]|uniref:Histidinol-phosphatase n=1 Tax=Methylacidiphilum caldifontis TaxID=2795386 RepID=A0A4Y8PCA2_9BACT|nr:histidinol-phosphatase HisJ family protein [Methylacidiphilum caldifontis]QSR89051.1 histidinol-phosphatase HisJ family protein [Methylacidiphilum caldifontis]TFE67398.1 histidinol phosphate phosphatase [Methylacidiphilum caldifontis]